MKQLVAGVLCGLIIGAAPASAGTYRKQPRFQRDVQVQVFEDGSAKVFKGGVEIDQIEDGVFVWNCKTMGNKKCGPRR